MKMSYPLSHRNSMRHNLSNKECDYGKVIEGFHTDDCTCPVAEEKQRDLIYVAGWHYSTCPKCDCPPDLFPNKVTVTAITKEKHDDDACDKQQKPYLECFYTTRAEAHKNPLAEVDVSKDTFPSDVSIPHECEQGKREAITLFEEEIKRQMDEYTRYPVMMANEKAYNKGVEAQRFATDLLLFADSLKKA